MLWLREKLDGLSCTEQPNFDKLDADVFAGSLTASTVAKMSNDAAGTADACSGTKAYRFFSSFIRDAIKLEL